jgi:hypothetical protein
MEAVFATTGVSSLKALAQFYYLLTGVGIVTGLGGAFLLYRKYRKKWLWLLAPVIGLVSAAVVTVIFFGGLHVLAKL